MALPQHKLNKIIKTRFHTNLNKVGIDVVRSLLTGDFWQHDPRVVNWNRKCQRSSPIMQINGTRLECHTREGTFSLVLVHIST